MAELPMDGFNLPNSRLAEIGALERKGALDTFDASELSRSCGDWSPLVQLPFLGQVVADVHTNRFLTRLLCQRR